MRAILLIVCCGTSVALAAEKPILVLDAGGHTAYARKTLFSQDEKELISVSWDKTIRVWDAASGAPLRVLRLPIGVAREGQLFASALNPDGTTLAVAGYGFGPEEDRQPPIYIVSLSTGQIERLLTGHENSILNLAFSPDGRQLISVCKDQTARIWSMSTGKTEQILRGHSDEIYGVTFSPDGRLCATASNDHTAAVWDVVTGQRQAVLKGHSAQIHGITWRPDGLVLATGSDDHSIRLWAPDGKAYQVFDKLGERGITSVAFTADSKRLLYTQGRGKGPFITALFDVATGRDVSRFGQHTDTIMHGTLSRDGTLALTSDVVGGIFVWKTIDGTRVQKLVGQGRVPVSTGWSSDGARIAWGNTRQTGSANGSNPLERLFDLASLEFGSIPDDRFVRAKPDSGNLSLALNPKNAAGLFNSASVRQGDRTLAMLAQTAPSESISCFTLLSGDRAAVGTNFRLRLYEARTGKQLRTFQVQGPVSAVSPSPDGRYLLAALGNMTLSVLDPDRDEPLLSCFFAGDDWIVWTPEGYYAASPGGEKLMGWHVNNGREQMASFYPASQFRSTLYRPDVIKLLLKTGSVERALEIADTARGRMTAKTEVAEVLPPQVRITSPAAARKTQTNTLEVRATANSVGKHPVTALRLLLDGRPYQGQKGVHTITSPKLGEVTNSWQIELEPGKHQLKVLADSEVSQGISEEVEVVYVGGNELVDQVRLPKLYVVAVGITDYPGDLKLNYAAKDAEVLAAALKSHSQPLFREIEVQTITNAQATRAAVLKGLGWLRSNMTQSDYGIFFFAGHRDLDNDGSVYFLPVDVDPQDLLSTAIQDDQFKRALAGIPGKLMTMLDACHSGALAGSQTGKRRAAGSSLTDDLVRDLVTDENGVVAMCSSTGREFSLENNEFRQGNFTLALVEGLSGKGDFNKDGVVYLNELDTYVTDRVKELTKGQQHPVTAKPGSIRSFPLAKPASK